MNAYTQLQAQAIEVFQAMYDQAAKYRASNDAGFLQLHCGICDNIEYASDSVKIYNSSPFSRVKDNVIRRLDSFSGQYHYPVKPSVEFDNAEHAWERSTNRWTGEYGANRLAQLGELIAFIKSDEWDDSLTNTQTPAKQYGIEVGTMVEWHRTDGEPVTLWKLSNDDGSADPYFIPVDTDASDRRQSIHLNQIKVMRTFDIPNMSVARFLAKVSKKQTALAKLQAQMATIQEQLNLTHAEIASYDRALAKQHKVKRA